MSRAPLRNAYQPTTRLSKRMRHGRLAPWLVLMVLLPASASPVPALVWRIEPVDVDHVFRAELDIASDASGALHVVYARDVNTVYLKQELGLWLEQLVVPGGGGGAIALGPGGEPHISHGYGEARYSAKLDGVWTHELIPGGRGWKTDIAVDHESRAHVLTRRSGGGLLYAMRDAGGAWTTETLSAAEGTGAHGIAVDSQGRPHVVFPTSVPLGLAYMTKTASGWQSQQIATIFGQEADIAIDSNDRLHVVYNDQFGRRLYYAHNDGTGWTTTVALRAGTAMHHNAIAVDASGKPHVVYSERLCFCTLEALAGHPWYATPTADGTWTSALIDPSALAYGLAITADPNGVPRVLYGVIWDQALETIRRPVGRYDLQYAEPLTQMPSRVPRALV